MPRKEETIPLNIVGTWRKHEVRPKSQMIKDEIWISADYETPADVAARLLEASNTLVDAVCDCRTSDYDDNKGLYVVGWRPMTDIEISAMERELPKYEEKQRELKLSREQFDRAQYERLREQFEPRKGNNS